MKKITFIVLSIIITNISYSQTINSPYEVGTWPGFRSAAISYTFDDGCSNQFVIAIPVFNEFGFNLTMFTVINWSPNWTALQAAASKGHEIASHTMSHARLADLTIALQKPELENSKVSINTHITGQKCVTTAYPYCVKGNDSLCKAYYIAARGCQGFVEPSTPGDFMNVSSIVCGDLGSIKTTQDFNSKAENTATSKGWCVYLIHGIDNDGGYSPLPSTTLLESVQYLYARKHKFWVSTFGNVSLYVKERNALSVKESLNQDTIITVNVTDTLVDSIFNYPVTIRRPLPKSWPSADVTQNGKAGEVHIVLIDTIKYIMFDAIPDGGDVILSKNKNTVTPGIDTIVPPVIDTIIKLKPTSIRKLESNDQAVADILRVWLNNSNLMFSVPTSARINLVVTLYDLKGTSIAEFRMNRSLDGVGYIFLPKNIIKSGLYIVHVTDGMKSWSKQIPIL